MTFVYLGGRVPSYLFGGIVQTRGETRSAARDALRNSVGKRERVFLGFSENWIRIQALRSLKENHQDCLLRVPGFSFLSPETFVLSTRHRLFKNKTYSLTEKNILLFFR